MNFLNKLIKKILVAHIDRHKSNNISYKQYKKSKLEDDIGAMDLHVAHSTIIVNRRLTGTQFSKKLLLDCN